MNLTRRAALVASAFTPNLIAAAAQSQSFPSRVVRLVVPYPAGGPTDVLARIVAQQLNTSPGWNVIVENIAGASGAIGSRAVAKAEADGHTIILGNNQSHGNNMQLLKSPGYNAITDFVPLAGIGAFEHVLVTGAAHAGQNLTAVVALARSMPERLTYGSTGLGSGSHLSMLIFARIIGATLLHVPFRGAAQLVQELIAGRLDVSNAPLPSVLGSIQGRQITAVGIASPRRNPSLPDVPTFVEQGIEGANTESWTAFFAPAATASSIVSRFSAAILDALSLPQVVAAIQAVGFTLQLRDPTEFRAYHAREMSVWAEIIRSAGIVLPE